MGFATKGVVYLLIGGLALVVAAGLVAYGVFQFVLAKYRQIPSPA